jgi:glycosyltransferase involved in cell wall biosynthesis
MSEPRPRLSISVLVPAHDRAHHLETSIQSALSQTDAPEEVIVVDDGSTDDTHDRVTAIEDPRLRYVWKSHGGAPATRNRAVAEARGEYVLWLDSDDRLHPGALAHYRELLAREPGIDVAYGDLVVTDAELRPQRGLTYGDWADRNQELLGRIALENPIPNPGSLVRRSLYARFGGYDESFRRAHDYEWWSRVARSARFRHCGGVVVDWRWHDRNMSTGSVRIDTSFDARVVRRVAERYALSELFPDLGWERRPLMECEAIACLRLAVRLSELGDDVRALEWAQCSRERIESHEALQAIAALEQRVGRAPVAAA